MQSMARPGPYALSKKISALQEVRRNLKGKSKKSGWTVSIEESLKTLGVKLGEEQGTGRNGEELSPLCGSRRESEICKEVTKLINNKETLKGSSLNVNEWYVTNREL